MSSPGGHFTAAASATSRRPGSKTRRRTTTVRGATWTRRLKICRTSRCTSECTPLRSATRPRLPQQLLQTRTARPATRSPRWRRRSLRAPARGGIIRHAAKSVHSASVRGAVFGRTTVYAGGERGSSCADGPMDRVHARRQCRRLAVVVAGRVCGPPGVVRRVCRASRPGCTAQPHAAQCRAVRRSTRPPRMHEGASAAAAFAANDTLLRQQALLSEQEALFAQAGAAAVNAQSPTLEADHLSHIDAGTGSASMVDVSSKPTTSRSATAVGRVYMPFEAAQLVRSAESRGGVSGKGPVLHTAQLAGIMAAKRTADLIPLCHPCRSRTSMWHWRWSTSRFGELCGHRVYRQDRRRHGCRDGGAHGVHRRMS